MDGTVWNVLAELRVGAGPRRASPKLHVELCSEMWRAIRYDRNMSVVLVGIELASVAPSFESEEARDDVFASLESWATQSIRLADHFGRMGGGAYGFVLTETDEIGARAASKRIVRDSQIGELLTTRRRAFSSVWIGSAAVQGVEMPEGLLARARHGAAPCESLGRGA